MAYIPEQLRVDTERENRRLGFLNQAMQSFGDIAKARQAALEKEKLAKKAQDDQANDLASKGISGDMVAEAQKSGDFKGIRNLLAQNAQTDLDYKRKIAGADAEKKVYDAEQLKLPPEERDDYKKYIAGQQARGAAEQTRFDRNQQAQIEQENRRLENEKKQKLTEAQIPGYDIADPNIIPSQKDAEEVKKLTGANKTFTEVGTRALGRLDGLDDSLVSLDRTGFSNKWKGIQQDLTEMRLQAKELANLGVLNGPDLKLVDDTLGSVGSMDINLYGKKAVKERLQEAVKTAQQKLQNAASARGYKPRISVQDKVKSYTPEQLAARKAELLQKMQAAQSGQGIPGAP